MRIPKAAPETGAAFFTPVIYSGCKLLCFAQDNEHECAAKRKHLSYPANNPKKIFLLAPQDKRSGLWYDKDRKEAGVFL